MRRILCSILFCLGISPLSAQEVRWYQIELIVFENLSPASFQAENWPDDPGFPDFTQAIELRRFNEAGFFNTTEGLPGSAEAPFSDPSEAFILLDASDRQLNTVSARLQQAQDYNVLAHVAWRQPFEKGGEPVPIHFHSYIGEPDPPKRLHRVTVRKTYRVNNVPEPLDTRLSDGTDLASATFATGQPFIEQMEELLPVPLVYPLDGIVKIRLGRYLHLSVDLILQRDLTTQVDPAANAQDTTGFFQSGPEENRQNANLRQEITRTYQFRFVDSRRMRSKELHYLDHPIIGVIAYMTPYDPFAGPEDEGFQ